MSRSSTFFLAEKLAFDRYGNRAIRPWPAMQKEDLEKLLALAEPDLDVKMRIPHSMGHLNAFVSKTGRPWLRDANRQGLEWVWVRKGHIPPMWTTLVSAYVVPLREIMGQKVCLAVHEGAKPRFHHLLGGTVEKGENPIIGAVREAQEESGVILNPSSLRLLKIQHLGYPRDTPDRVIYYYLLEGAEALRDWDKLIREKGDGELEGALWVSRRDNFLEPHVREALSSIPGW